MILPDEVIRDALMRSDIRVFDLLVRDLGTVLAVWGLVDSDSARRRAERAIRSVMPKSIAFHLTPVHAPRLTPLTSGRSHADSAETYTVQRGETLQDIARKVYADPDKWTLIRDANRARLPDPACIRQGTMLLVPWD